MAMENVKFMHESSPEHLRMGTVNWNKTKKRRTKVSRNEETWNEVQGGTKNRSLDCLIIVSRAYRPPGSILTEEAVELLNAPNLHLYSTNYSLGSVVDISVP